VGTLRNHFATIVERYKKKKKKRNHIHSLTRGGLRWVLGALIKPGKNRHSKEGILGNFAEPDGVQLPGGHKGPQEKI